MRLSVIIPSWKDPYLIPTIRSLLDNSELEDQMEILVVLDGYWRTDIPNDPRLKILHLGANRGMRSAINAGVRVAKGEYVARSDEHCHFSKGWDRILLETIQDDWIVYPLRYALDPEKWEIIKEIPPVGVEKLIIDKKRNKFAGVPWARRETDEPLSESLAMQGSFWCLKRSLWDRLGELPLDGGHYGDSLDLTFGVWKLGGKLMVNRRCWYAHKFREFNRTHHLSHEEAAVGWAHSLEKYGEYYKTVICPRWQI